MSRLSSGTAASATRTPATAASTTKVATERTREDLTARACHELLRYWSSHPAGARSMTRSGSSCWTVQCSVWMSA